MRIFKQTSLKLKTLLTITIAINIAIILCASSLLQAQILPIGEPGTELFYMDLLHKRATGKASAQDYQLAPYISQSTSANINGAFTYWPQNKETLRFYFSPTEEISGEQKSRTGAATKIRGGVTSLLSDKVSVMSSFILDENLANNPNYNGKVWRGLAGDVETALLTYHNERLTILAGRYRASWGPQFTNLLLSQTAAPLDGATIRYRLGSKLTFSYQFARLDPLSPDVDSADVFVNRYLAAHRIDLRLSKSVRIGLFESVLFAGPGRGMELQFLNPLNFFHGNQLNENNNDNTFLGFDYDLRIKNRLNLYGQLLVDDFQIEKEVQGDQEPNEIGSILGARIIDALPKTDLKIQWSKVTNRTYNQKLTRNRYINQDIPIGHPLGNDFEIIELGLLHRLPKMNVIHLIGKIQRRGQARITDNWSEPWLATSEPYTEPFPTGIIEKVSSIEFDYLAQLPQFLNGSNNDSRGGLLRATVGWQDIKNELNVLNSNRTSFYLRLNFSLFLAGDIKLN